ncbi:MAG: Ig domain-containing protein [Deltaproteobacteria bacterium]
MKSLLVCFALSIFIIPSLGACRRAEEPPAETESAQIDAESGDASEDGYDEESGEDAPSGDDNNLPKLISISIATVVNGDIRSGFRAIPTASDADGDEISFRYQWSRNDRPVVGARDSILPWGEDFKRGDKISVEVTVSDTQNLGAGRGEGEFKIPNSPPRIVSEPKPRIEDGKFDYTIKAEDADGDAVEYSIRNAPKGMTIEPATGRIKWDFSEGDVGEYSVEVVATDTEGARGRQVLSLSIPENP